MKKFFGMTLLLPLLLVGCGPNQVTPASNRPATKSSKVSIKSNTVIIEAAVRSTKKPVTLPDNTVLGWKGREYKVIAPIDRTYAGQKLGTVTYHGKNSGLFAVMKYDGSSPSKVVVFRSSTGDYFKAVASKRPQVQAQKPQTEPSAIVPIWIVNVEHVTVAAFTARNPIQPVNSVEISSNSEKQKIVYEINTSTSVPLPTTGTTVVTPAIKPNSVSYKVTVWIKNGYPRIFKIGSWGPTYDAVYKEDLSPGLSRNLLRTVSVRRSS